MSETARKRGLPLRVKMRHDQHFVEELATRHSDPVGRMLPLSAIEPDPEQPRSSMGSLDDLVASIRDKGVLEPILVRPVPGALPDATVQYRIISGERRYRAAKEAGLYDVPVVEMDVDEDEALEIALIENLQRKDLTVFEEAEGYRALADRHGYTHEQIAEAVGRSRTAITESLRFLEVPPRARDAVEALGLTSKSLLLELVKAARDEEDLIRLLEEAAAKGWSRDDVRAAAKSPQRAASQGRRKPYTFKFRSPDKSYSLALTFRKTEVDRTDLIAALESILQELREAQD